MKLKYFLRGLGVGMVVTALVLCIAYRNSSSGKSVVEQAKELGMVFPQGTSEPDVTATPESENTKKPKSTKKAATKEPAKKASETKKPAAASGAGVSAAVEKATKKPTKKPKTTAASVVTVNLEGNWISSTVARELEKRGVVKSASQFDHYLEKDASGKATGYVVIHYMGGSDYKNQAEYDDAQSTP